MARGGSFVLFTMLAGGIGVATMTIGGPHETVLVFKHAFSLFRHLRFDC